MNIPMLRIGAILLTLSVAIGLQAATAPSITTQPSSQSVAVGSNALFSVTALGIGPNYCQWSINGTALVDDGSHIIGATNIIGNGGTGTLTISNVIFSDAGNYQVVITNSHGSATSSVAVLTVLTRPVITAQPTNVSVLVGGSGGFGATFFGTSPMTCQWQKAGVNLTDGGNLSGTSSSNLVINPVGLADAGNYRLIITNLYGSTTSSVVTLTVLTPPVITAQPTNMILTISRSGSVGVTNYGTAPLTFRWQKAGVNMVDTGNISGTATSNLVFNPVKLVDSGFYQLIITNLYGSATSSVIAVSIDLSGTNFVGFDADSFVVLPTTETIASNLTINANGHNVTLSGNTNCRVFAVNSGVQLTLEGITVANGFSTNGFGGGLFNAGSTIVDNCTFSNNTVLGPMNYNGLGGGIYNTATLVINQSTFVANQAKGGTGLTGTASGSSSQSGGPGFDGAAGAGGAVYNAGGTVFITNSTFFGNTALGGTGGTGGSGFNGYSYQYVCGSYCCGFACSSTCYNYCTAYVYGTIGGNGGKGGVGVGGNLYQDTGSLMIINSTFAGGTAAGGAAGLAGPTGSYGSGSGSSGTVGVGMGGNIGQDTGTFTMKNCITANAASGGNFSATVIVDAGNNLSSDASLALTNATSLTNANANLGALTGNGGSTWTMALLTASPAIHAGDTNGAPRTDQRGVPRKPLQIDIGSYETPVVTSSVPPFASGTLMPSGNNPQFQLAFTNTAGTTFSVWTSTNLTVPFSSWVWAGYARETAPGFFQFNDGTSVSNLQKFYRLTSP